MKIFATIVFLLIQINCFCQNDFVDQIVILSEIYHKYHASTPTTATFEKLEEVNFGTLNTTKEFIGELIKDENSLATKKYLTKPDTNSLKVLYTVRAVNYNMFRHFSNYDRNVVYSVINLNTSYQELLSCYYSMLFGSIGNKNRPLDMSKVNFEMSEYSLNNKVEKGIFFLESMETFGVLIWGYMNVPDPPNYKKAIRIIKNYPTYNGQPYYKYTELDFEDFLLRIDLSKPNESFKKYYLNKYLNTIIYHSVCLQQKKKNRKQSYEVIEKSIVPKEQYWKYSDSQDFFENNFKNIED